MKLEFLHSGCWRCLTHHDEPCDERCISDIPEAAVIDVCLHLQVEEEALIDDVGDPATTSAQKRICLSKT